MVSFVDDRFMGDLEQAVSCESPMCMRCRAPVSHVRVRRDPLNDRYVVIYQCHGMIAKRYVSKEKRLEVSADETRRIGASLVAELARPLRDTEKPRLRRARAVRPALGRHAGGR